MPKYIITKEDTDFTVSVMRLAMFSKCLFCNKVSRRSCSYTASDFKKGICGSCMYRGTIQKVSRDNPELPKYVRSKDIDRMRRNSGMSPVKDGYLITTISSYPIVSRPNSAISKKRSLPTDDESSDESNENSEYSTDEDHDNNYAVLNKELDLNVQSPDQTPRKKAKIVPEEKPKIVDLSNQKQGLLTYKNILGLMTINQDYINGMDPLSKRLLEKVAKEFMDQHNI